jgi:hypothetical protein
VGHRRTLDILEAKNSESVVLCPDAGDGKVEAKASPRARGTAICWWSKSEVSRGQESRIMDYRRELDHFGAEIDNISTRVMSVGASTNCSKEDPKVRLRASQGEFARRWDDNATTLTEEWEQCTALPQEGGAAVGPLESRPDEHNSLWLHRRVTTGGKVKFAETECVESWTSVCRMKSGDNIVFTPAP